LEVNEGFARLMQKLRRALCLQNISYLTSRPSNPPAMIGFFQDAFNPIFLIYPRSPK